MVQERSQRAGPGSVARPFPNGAGVREEYFAYVPQARFLGIKRKRCIHQVACCRQPLRPHGVRLHPVPHHLLHHSMQYVPGDHAVNTHPLRKRIPSQRVDHFGPLVMVGKRGPQRLRQLRGSRLQ